MLKFTISFYAFSLFYLGAHLSLISIAGMVLVVTRNCYWLKTWTGRLQSWEVVFLWVYRGRGIEDCGCLWVWYRGSFQEASGGSAFRCQEGRVTFWLKGWTSRGRRQLWGSTAWPGFTLSPATLCFELTRAPSALSLWSSLYPWLKGAFTFILGSLPTSASLFPPCWIRANLTWRQKANLPYNQTIFSAFFPLI